MPSIKDESTVDKIAEIFCGEGKRNKAVTLRAIGYADSTCVSGTCREKIYENIRVKAAIARIDATNQAKADYNYDKAMLELNELIATLRKQVESGNIQAKSLYLAVIKEKNCITGLQQQVNINKGDGLNINITEAGTYPRKVKA